jgi:hypothetical protein
MVTTEYSGEVIVLYACNMSVSPCWTVFVFVNTRSLPRSNQEFGERAHLYRPLISKPEQGLELSYFNPYPVLSRLLMEGSPYLTFYYGTFISLFSVHSGYSIKISPLPIC